MNALIKNTVICLPQNQDTKRILYVSQGNDLIVSIPMRGRRCSPGISSHCEWSSMLENGDLEIINDPTLDLPFSHALTDGMISRKEKAWTTIEPLVKDIPAIFESRYRNNKISIRAVETNCHVDSIRDWLCEYWQMGCTPSALFGKRNNCGAPGKIKPSRAKTLITPEGDTTVEVKRGAPRSKTPGIGMNISEEHRNIIRVATNLFYKKNKKATLKLAYLKMIHHYYRDKITIDSKGKISITHPDEIPTYQQFIYWYKKQNEEYDVVIARKGRTYFEKTLRPLLGNSTFESIGPGYRYQIDATIADVYLVSRIDRNTIVGRPVFYVVIDVWSRLIVGLYIGLEQASWATAMMAIHNVTLNKVEFCRQFDIEIDPDEWPNTPLASVLLGDRGELLSKQADRLAEVLDVENTPPYRADWKGIVERQFRLLPAKFAADVKGYVEKDFVQRTGPDYRLDASLTLHEFTKIAIHCILEHNTTPINGYPLENSMVAQEIPAIPSHLWKWGSRNRMGALVRHSENKLIFALLPTAEVSVTANGISFLGRNYYSAEVHQRNWFTKARGKGRFKVTISYHPHNLNNIYLHDPAYRDNFTVCTLISTNTSDLCLYVEEVLANAAKARKTNTKMAYDVLGRQLTHQKAIEDIARTANDEKTEIGEPTQSKKDRISNIRSYRLIEKAINRITNYRTGFGIPMPKSAYTRQTAVEPQLVDRYARVPIFADNED
ncbi:Mu transposase C-terminal domain-containing protein [Massilia sp. DD77]|uniref:Mu transposase C-terminal domain-containing protein n=1 Tax=Massilia sp. DD77 TaxID=3109349 RepID=UPI002FFD5BE0